MDVAPPVEDLPTTFRLAMRRLAATVSVVTAAPRLGMAATSVASLTLDPPALLVCVNRTASIFPALVRGAAFCVNVLASTHGDLSAAFGGRLPREARFGVGDWRFDGDPETATPWLADAQSNIFCRVDALLDYGTHRIIVGLVERVRLHGAVDPLIWSDGRVGRV
jgi:flavin reductase